MTADQLAGFLVTLVVGWAVADLIVEGAAFAMEPVSRWWRRRRARREWEVL